MAKKKKKSAVDITLWDVILSYPDLHDPKPYKGKVYYKTDILLDDNHPQLEQLNNQIKKVKTETFGPDKSEWPKEKVARIQNGNDREDQAGYKDRQYITASTQTPVPVVDLKGRAFNAQMVKGGMYANVAIRISAWEYDGDEGVSIYLQGVQVDTTKPGLNFGGGKSVKQMFSRDGDDNDENTDDSDDDSDSDNDSDEDSESKDREESRSRKSKKNFTDDEDNEDDDEE